MFLQFAFVSLNLIFIYLIIGIFFISGLYLFFLVKKKKKKRKETSPRIIQPITEIIGSSKEQIEILNDELEQFGFIYDPYQDLFYSLMDCWQRKFGYCRLYDEACAPLSMIIDCEPIRFEYKDKKYLIQFWKGQYGMTTGGEVGIYYTSGPDINIPGVFNGTFYHVVKDEDLINMSFAFYKNGNLLFTRSAKHWWLTGFKLGEFSCPYELSMDIIIELYDREMALAFVNGLKKVGYTEARYAIEDRRVYVRFNEPLSKQPYTRTSLATFFGQRNNRHWCDTYYSLTREYTETYDKVGYIRHESPEMYQKILNMGKVPKVYEGYKKIKSFISKDSN